MSRDWQVGEQIAGFTVTRRRESAKAGGSFYEMIHDRTGASLCWADNNAENKLFSVAFRTVPQDDTGVFHILEHSVLCGSETYPVREPFLELLKSSMQTFLNAMTYPDKTVYPVSSRNEQDFLNLTSVYLDAVFAPRLLEDPNIFYQEGQHLTAGPSGASFNGVVLNEMKGAVSDVNDRIEHGVNALLFPDSCYRYNSGGDPASIVDLTYDRFRETYRRFYHPSNARFYLDGDVPVTETLAMIDGYLQKFTRQDGFPAIPTQTPRRAEATARYALDTDEGNREILAYGKIIGTYDQVTRLFAAQILCDVLAFSNDAPLSKALLRDRLAEDVELYVSDGIFQPYLMLVIRNTAADRIRQAERTVQETVRALVQRGIPKADLLASVNKLEFGFRQTPEPQGLYRMSAVLDAWLYDGDPLLYLETDGVFAELRRMIETDAYERLAEELLLDDAGLVKLHLQPSTSLTREAEAREAEKAQARLDAMDQAALAELEQQNAALAAWQETPDDPAAVAALPTLTLADVAPVPKLYQTDVTEVDGVRVLYHPAAANGIVHLSAYLPLTAFSLEELSLLAVLPEFYGELPTAHYGVTELQREIKTWIGWLHFDIGVAAKRHDTAHCRPQLVLRASVLRENLDRAQALLAEILTQTRFDDADAMYDILRQVEEENRQACIASGHSLAAGVVRASYTARGAASEAAGGYTFVRTVRSLVRAFNEQRPALLALIDRMQRTALCRPGVTISVTAEQPADLHRFIDALPEGTPAPALCAYQADYPTRTGIPIPSPVSYAVKGYRPGPEREIDGSLWVVGNLVSLAYLWTKLRVQGGAYGAGLQIARDEGFICHSYRDPAPADSLRAYDGIGAFLRAFAESGEPLDKYIISTVSSSDPLLTPRAEGTVADEFYFSGVTDAMRIQTRQEMLHTDQASLRSWAEVMDEMAARGVCCVVGGEEALAACGDLTLLP